MGLVPHPGERAGGALLRHLLANAKRPERVVVIGARGFIGRQLVSRLAADGFSSLAPPSDDLDLRDPGSAARLAQMLRPGDAVVMLAAARHHQAGDLRTFVENIQIGQTVCAATAAAPCAHVVYFSSDAVYPDGQEFVTEQSCAQPTSLYGAMHLAREFMFRRSVGDRLLVARPTLVYGPADPHDTYGLDSMIRSALHKRRIEIFGAGEDTRDQVLVDDVVSLTLLALLHRTCGVLNLATGVSTPRLELARVVADRFDDPVEIVRVPRRRPASRRRFATDLCRKSFPTFQWTPLPEGVGGVVERERLS